MKTITTTALALALGLLLTAGAWAYGGGMFSGEHHFGRWVMGNGGWCVAAAQEPAGLDGR
jgi:hypothetical protein